MSGGLENDGITCERYLAYFDIMGFKDLVYRGSHEKVLAELDSALEIVPTKEELQKDVQFRMHSMISTAIFSDTILFYTDSDTRSSLQDLIKRSVYFFMGCLRIGVPLKGAVSKGLFTADPSRSRYAGRPLVDAYNLADEVNFYGTVFHHSAEQELLAKPTIMVGRDEIPMKAGKITHSYYRWPHSWDEDLDPTLAKLYGKVSGNTRKYVDNTALVYKADREAALKQREIDTAQREKYQHQAKGL